MRWFLVDVAAVVLFASVGRASHDEGLDLTGVATTAWPFLVGLALGWTVVTLRGVGPLSWAAGTVLWVSTVVGGMVLRAATDAGTAPAFVVVATVVTAVLLLGWRAAARRSLPAARRHATG
jgi:hypothetical protein